MTPELVWQMSDSELLAILNDDQSIPRLNKIRFFAPSFTYYKTRYYQSTPKNFPTISVTGNSCSLNCKHCGGKLLETMYPADEPEKLFQICTQIKKDGAEGCLISGGCLPNGSVPIQRFVNAIKQVKRDLDLTVFVHTGIVDKDVAGALADARVDAALIDIIGSDETIREVCNIDVTTKDYANSLQALEDAGLPFVPHVIVGLHYGTLKGEWDALKMISQHQPSALVIISFMPIKRTEMQQVIPPKPLDITRTIATARLMFPNTPLALGCMRPQGEHRAETDVLAIKAGADAIAFPAEEAIEFTIASRIEFSFSSLCCAQTHAA